MKKRLSIILALLLVISGLNLDSFKLKADTVSLNFEFYEISEGMGDTTEPFETQNVKVDNKIKMPKHTREGYKLVAWKFKDKQHSGATKWKRYELSFNKFLKFASNNEEIIFYDTKGGEHTRMAGSTVQVFGVWEEAPVEVEKEYKVTFDADDGLPVPQKQTVKAGEKVLKPKQNPKKDGYEFLYWFLVDGKPLKPCGVDSLKPCKDVDEAGNIIKPKDIKGVDKKLITDNTIKPLTIKPAKFDFENYQVTKDITLKAYYKKLVEKPVEKPVEEPAVEQVVVKFDTRGGTPKPQDQTVNIGDKVVKPVQDPAKDGYTFKAWYDAEGKYNFDNPVERPITLYANYAKDGETTDVRNRGDIDITDNEYPMAIMEYKLPFFEGYPDDTFRPNNTIIRAEMATVFARILGLEGHEYTGNKSFSDLDGHWAKNDILLVAEYGLLNGYKDGSFKPDGEMKRAEICSIINKYWELKGFEPNIEDADISDVDNHWAKELILGLYNHRFVDLNEQNAFRPDEPLKRDEVAQILNRITDRTIKANYTPSYKDVGKSHWAFKEVEAASNVSE